RGDGRRVLIHAPQAQAERQSQRGAGDFSALLFAVFLAGRVASEPGVKHLGHADHHHLAGVNGKIRFYPNQWHCTIERVAVNMFGRDEDDAHPLEPFMSASTIPMTEPEFGLPQPWGVSRV